MPGPGKKSMRTLPTGLEPVTDVHMHLIPGVDDGATDLEMAMGLLRRAREEGIGTVCATPHSSAFDWDPALVRERFQDLRQESARFFPDMALYLGCEVYCDARHMADVAKALEEGRYPGLNGTKYLLTEFSVGIQPEQALRCAGEILRLGWIPVIAHMERYRHLRHDTELVDRLREMGCRIQINAYSLYNEEDADIRGWAQKLALEQKADFLGTDAHRTWHRPPSAARGVAWLFENAPGEYARALCGGNARRLLGLGEKEV